MKEPTGNTALNLLADRYLNTALHDIHLDPGHQFPWSIRKAYLITHKPYSTGTVAIDVSTSRTAVTGSSTAWNTAVTGYTATNAQVGGKIKFSGRQVYEVSAVGSDTSITLNPGWQGEDLSGDSYTYFEDEYALASDFLRPLDLTSFSLQRSIPLIGPLQFRRSFPSNDIPGKPSVATIIDNIGYSSSTTPRPRVILAPPPNDEYPIPYDYITSFLAVTNGGTAQTQMTNTTDEPIIPLGMRPILVLHAAYNWLMFREDDTRSQEVKAEYVDLLQRMVGTSNYGQDRPRMAVDISRYFGQRRLGRFDSESGAFDQLRDRWGR